jgi:sporulation protein YlmC with PRC-barrel domain
MRLSDLLASEVVDTAGHRIGHVHDVRIAQDGPLHAGFDASFRVQGLIVGRGGLASRLGYGRTRSRGPWLIRHVLESHHAPTFIPWVNVKSIEGHRVTVTGRGDEGSRADPLPDARQGAQS